MTKLAILLLAAPLCAVGGASAGLWSRAVRLDHVRGAVGLVASSADAFVDSMGIDAHLNYLDTAYGNFTGVKLALADIGLRHIRDGCVAAAYGANLLEGVDVLCLPSATTSTRQLDFTALERLLTNATAIERLAGLEGPNEYDLSGDRFWPQMDAAYQALMANLSASIVAPTRPAGSLPIPLVAPSMGWGPQHATPLCSATGNGERVCTKANMHSYPGGGPPIHGLLQNIHANAWVVAPAGTPIWATESGYHTATRQWPVVEQLGVDERTQAKYLPRLWLLYWSTGVIERTYVYELLDQKLDTNHSNPESDYGIVRFDFSYKPAAYATKNLIALLSEPGAPANFTPAPLDASLAVVQPVDPSACAECLNATVLGKTDGSYYLALWQEATSYDIDTQTEMPVANLTVTLTLPAATGTGSAAAFSRGMLYRVGQSGTVPVEVFDPLPAQLQLQVPDEVLVLQLLP